LTRRSHEPGCPDDQHLSVSPRPDFLCKVRQGRAIQAHHPDRPLRSRHRHARGFRGTEPVSGQPELQQHLSGALSRPLRPALRGTVRPTLLSPLALRHRRCRVDLGRQHLDLGVRQCAISARFVSSGLNAGLLSRNVVDKPVCRPA
jgi:hypothetical protein